LSIRVLLVDDHTLLREGLRAILAREPDVEVVGEAADGRTAVEMACTLTPDVVLMDVGMPDLNGIEATRQLVARSPRSRVIALSTHTDRRYVLGMLEVGAAGYISKVSAYSELRKAIRTVASGRTYLSPQIAEQVAASGAASRRPAAKSPLAPREREVLQLVAEGCSSLEIAERLHVSAHTVETHRRNIMQKLGLHSVADLTRYAIREGITSLDQ